MAPELVVPARLYNSFVFVVAAASLSLTHTHTHISRTMAPSWLPKENPCGYNCTLQRGRLVWLVEVGLKLRFGVYLLGVKSCRLVLLPHLLALGSADAGTLLATTTAALQQQHHGASNSLTHSLTHSLTQPFGERRWSSAS